ncbi:hypothetical protein [Rhodovulum marinum]|uniref:Uncharacterized protein n=1 Tax=Rhodovulum marinum TaxID=320662 RepID=A0A4R2Q640_9RHOB|nr:hypothetical protein [Rhodovulum marinum]TCP44140.1 hypothetical protein EV662_101227 [Rhodovulum marinum]
MGTTSTPRDDKGQTAVCRQDPWRQVLTDGAADGGPGLVLKHWLDRIERRERAG